MQAHDSNVVSFKREIPVLVNGPVEVVNYCGKSIGSCGVKIVDGGIAIDLHLDRNTPEAFDCELDPDRVELGVGGFLRDGTLSIKIYVITK